MSGMVLAAGYGTRLGGLSRLRPKPMLPVCNTPLVIWAARLLAGAGCQQLSVNLHHLGPMIANALDGSAAWRLPGGPEEVHYNVEETILGTGGGIRAMAEAGAPAETYLIANGKIVTDLDMQAALEFHHDRGALATMVLYPVADPRAWGAIGVDPQGRLTRLVDQTRTGADGSTEYLFTGIHIFSRELLKKIPQGPCCIIRSAYRELFTAGAPLFGYVHPGYFFEHSTPERYLQGNLNLLAMAASSIKNAPGPLRGVATDAELGPGATVHESALVGSGSTIGAGAKIGPLSVIGPGAIIAPGRQVERSVVWPQVEVNRDLSLAVATGIEVLRFESLGDPWARPRGA